MTRIETIKATSMPTARIAISMPEKYRPYLTILRRLAPNMTGIARMKVNWAATVLETPIMIPPRIVAPDREVPGKIAAISWNSPMMRASR